MQLIARATQVGEPLDQMLFCLQTMSVDRGLQEKKSPDYVGQRSPYFWICGRDTRPLNLCYAMAYHVLCLQLTRIIVRGNPARLAVSLSLSVSPPLANPACLFHRLSPTLPISLTAAALSHRQSPPLPLCHPLMCVLYGPCLSALRTRTRTRAPGCLSLSLPLSASLKVPLLACLFIASPSL